MSRNRVNFAFSVDSQGKVTAQEIWPKKAAEGLSVRFTVSGRQIDPKDTTYTIRGELARERRWIGRFYMATGASVDINFNLTTQQVDLVDRTRPKGRSYYSPTVFNVKVETVEPEPEAKTGAIVFPYKSRSAVSVVADSVAECYNALVTVQQQLAPIKYNQGYGSVIQVSNNLFVSYSDIDSSIRTKYREAQEEIAKLPADNFKFNKDLITRDLPALSIDGKKYRPDFTNRSNLYSVPGVEIAPEGMVELYGSMLSTTLLDSVMTSPADQEVLDYLGFAYSAGGFSSRYRQSYRRDADFDFIDLPCYRVRLVRQGDDRTVDIGYGKFVYFASDEEVTTYRREGGTLLSVNGASYFSENTRDDNQMYRQVDYETIPAKIGDVEVRTSARIKPEFFQRAFGFYLLKMSTLGDTVSYRTDSSQGIENLTSKVGAVFVRSSFSPAAMEQLVLRFVYYHLLAGGRSFDSKIEISDDVPDINPNEIVGEMNRKFNSEAFNRSLQEDIDYVRNAVLAVNNMLTFRVMAESRVIFPIDFVGAGQRTTKARFHKITVGGLEVQLLDPPQLGTNRCFESALAYCYQHLLPLPDNFDANNRIAVKEFCTANGINLKDENTTFTPQQIVVSTKLLPQDFKGVATPRDLARARKYDPDINEYAHVATRNGRSYVVYPYPLFDRPQLYIDNNHVYVVVSVFEKERHCSHCDCVSRLTFVKDRFVCEKCAKKLDQHDFNVPTDIAVYDTEDVPILTRDGLVTHQIVSIDGVTSSYFNYNPTDEHQTNVRVTQDVIDELSTHYKCSKDLAKKIAYSLHNYFKYEHFLMRDTAKIIAELNDKTKYTDEQALQQLTEQLRLQFFEVNNTQQFLNKLKNMHESGKHYSWYGHNASRYDSILLLHDAMKSEYFNDQKFLPVGSSVLEFDIYSHRFLDSYKLASLDLLSLSEGFSLGRFSKLECIKSSTTGKEYFMKDIFNLRDHYNKPEEFYDLLRDMGLYDAFIEYSKLDVISLIIIVILFKELSMKIVYEVIKSYDWYKEAPERPQFPSVPGVTITNKEHVIGLLMSRLFRSDAMTIGQIAQSVVTEINKFVNNDDEFYDFFGYTYNKNEETGAVAIRSKATARARKLTGYEYDRVVGVINYYRRNVSIPIEPNTIVDHNGEPMKTPSLHQEIESKSKIGGNSWVNKTFQGQMIISREQHTEEELATVRKELNDNKIKYLEVKNIIYVDIRSLYPTVMLGTEYYRRMFPDSPMLPYLEQIFDNWDFYPVYQGKQSITETTGATVYQLLCGATFPTDTRVYNKDGSYSMAILDNRSAFTCYLDYVIKTDHQMWSVIPSRSSASLDWDSPNIMSRRYRDSLTEEQYQAIVDRFGSFNIEEYIVANEVIVSELQRYNFIFGIDINSYAVIYHRKTRENLFYNFETVAVTLKKHQDDYASSKDPRYNKALRAILKMYANVPSGKTAQHYEKTKKQILPDNADIATIANYDTLTLFNGRLAVDAKSVGGTYCYIGTRIYSLAKKMLYYYAALEGWDKILKVETDGWAIINSTGTLDKFEGNAIGMLENKVVSRIGAVAKKCSIIYDDEKVPEITFKGCTKADLVNYGKSKLTGEQMKELAEMKLLERKEMLTLHGYQTAFYQMLATKKLEVDVKIFKRNVFGSRSSVTVSAGKKKFDFDPESNKKLKLKIAC